MTFARSSSLPQNSGRTLRIGVVVSTYHRDITDRLLAGCMKALSQYGVASSRVTLVRVPGSFELPYVAARLVHAKKVDAVICLGLILKGETQHDEIIAHSVASTLQQLNALGTVPVVFGVLTTKTRAQALARSRSNTTNKGYEAAMAAVAMARMKQ